MKKYDLTRFCSSDEMRPSICHPFSQGEWTYATDGAILVRVARRNEYAEQGKPRISADTFPFDHFVTIVDGPPRDWIMLDGLELPPTMEDCPTCGGPSKIPRRRPPYEMDGHFYSPYYLNILREEFSNVCIHYGSAVPSAEGAALVRFDEGLGYLMPVRWRNGD